MNAWTTKIAAAGVLLASVVFASAFIVSSAEAARLKLNLPLSDFAEIVQNLGDGDLDGSDSDADAPDDEAGGVSIRPREAAQIAKSAFPGAKVLKVKLLPSGVYAVTLRGDGKLTRVMVDGENGNIL